MTFNIILRGENQGFVEIALYLRGDLKGSTIRNSRMHTRELIHPGQSEERGNPIIKKEGRGLRRKCEVRTT